MAAETARELQQLKKRFSELADKSYKQNIYTFTGFLSLAEQEALFETARQEGLAEGRAFSLWGGGPDCERRMARFGSPKELGYEEEWPVAVLQIRPLMEKFADNLTHRDFLGAVMNLGIDRSTVGDILVEGRHAWICCTQKIAPYLCENLEQIRHTRVRCTPAEGGRLPDGKPPEQENHIVSGLRADAVLARVFRLSRNQSLELFRAGKVYVNSRLCENNSYLLREQDLVSVRGFGRFRFLEAGNETRKGKLNVRVEVFR